MTNWRDERRGAENLAYALPEEHMLYGLPCAVRHEDAGGECGQPSTMMVYSLLFCDVHGAEAKAGALEELYQDAAQELVRPLNSQVRRLNPETERILGRYWNFAAVASGVDHDAVVEEALVRAFPLARERVSFDTLYYLEQDRELQRGYDPPYDALLADRLLVHRLMRLAFEDGADWAVEILEVERQHIAAQAAFALVLEREAGLRPALA